MRRLPFDEAIASVALALMTLIPLLEIALRPLHGRGIENAAVLVQHLGLALAMFGAWMFYYRASRAIGFGMLVVFVAMAWLTRWLHDLHGTPGLLKIALSVFVLAWIAQFVGHSKLYEGKKPSFFTDLKYLLIGPAWVLAKLYRKLGWRW